jgi:hypothetical protein
VYHFSHKHPHVWWLKGLRGQEAVVLTSMIYQAKGDRAGSAEARESPEEYRCRILTVSFPRWWSHRMCSFLQQWNTAICALCPTKWSTLKIPAPGLLGAGHLVIWSRRHIDVHTHIVYTNLQVQLPQQSSAPSTYQTALSVRAFMENVLIPKLPNSSQESAPVQACLTSNLNSTL